MRSCERDAADDCVNRMSGTRVQNDQRTIDYIHFIVLINWIQIKLQANLIKCMMQNGTISMPIDAVARYVAMNPNGQTR